VINWFGPNSATNIAFKSGKGSVFSYQFTHPLTGSGFVFAQAGTYTPVIDRVIISGITFSNTGGTGTYDATLDCFDEVQVNPLTCDNGNTPTSAYTHSYSFSGTGSSSIPLNVTFQLSANTNYFGGITNAAGIFVMSQINANIVGNTIKNNIQSFGAPRGIELGVIAGNTTALSSFVNISRNIIRNIGTTLTGGAYGVYIDFGNTNSNVDRSIVIDNNMISGIFSGGSSRIGTTFSGNPFGVYLNATSNIGSAPNNNVGVNLYFNSINLGQANSLTATNSISACVGIPSFITNGISMQNNLFQNKEEFHEFFFPQGFEKMEGSANSTEIQKYET
jgi:hypothetical protein